MNLPSPTTLPPIEETVSTALAASREPRGKRLLFGLLGLLVAAMSFYWTWCLNAPAHGGVDQNGYLVGGRNVAAGGTMKATQRNPDTGQLDPFMFVSPMWVGIDMGTPVERFYPKYPLGLPALYAGLLRAGGERGRELPLVGRRLPDGYTLCLWLSPACMSLAVLACFGLGQILGGSYAGVLAALVFAASPVTLGLSTNPNSHASAVCCVAWGMLFLCWWWRGGGWIKGILAGLLTGYAATIRYTEGLLVLPLVYVVIERALPGLLPWNWTGLRDRYGIRPVKAPTRWQRWQGLAVILGWALPVAILVIYNLRAMGTLTGYDNTNESAIGSAFKWEHFRVNWYTTVTQLNDIALAFVLPLGLAGLAWMFRWNFRLATAMLLWIVPGAIVYSCYYWAPQQELATRYMRFFLTIMPGLAVCAFAGLSRVSVVVEGRAAGSMASTVAAGILAALATVQGAYEALPAAESDAAGRQVLAYNAQAVKDLIHTAGLKEEDAVIIAGDMQALDWLQFTTRARLYNASLFNERFIRALTDPQRNPDDPDALDPHRRQALKDRIEQMIEQRIGKPLAQLGSGTRALEIFRTLEAQEKRIVADALAHGRGVFILDSGFPATRRLGAIDSKLYELKTVARWSAPVHNPPEPDRPTSLRTAGRRAALAGDRPERYSRTFWTLVRIVRKESGENAR
ncbi:MAG: glycosyltransferase family 39 protein [Tepidisphaerales bacterium]